MQPVKLNSYNRRLDFELDNESTAFFISNGTSRQSIDCDDAGLSQAAQNEQLIVQTLDQDDGVVARVVLGKLKKQENEEWIERGSRILDLSDDTLVIAGGNTFVSSKNTDEDLEDEAEFYQPLLVRPNRYLVTIYTHAPCINGFRLTRHDEWPGFLPYFQSTRPRRKYPGWLIEFANLQGEGIDSIPEKKIADHREPWVDFVVQLEPVPESASVSDLDRGYRLQTESRLPEKCPLGIIPVEVESQEATPKELAEHERIEAAEQKARFGDRKQLAKTFRPFAEALFQKDLAEAANFFVPELRAAAEKYMDWQRNRRSKWEPLEDIWLDKQNSEESIRSWRSNFEQHGNLFAPALVTPENYLGDLRCEYGNSNDYAKGKIRRYLIVDAPIISTPAGPQLAGLYFS